MVCRVRSLQTGRHRMTQSSRKKALLLTSRPMALVRTSTILREFECVCFRVP